MSPKGGFDLAGYVDVDARLAWFFEKYPEGSLQSEVLVGPETGSSVITVKATAIRYPGDMCPGVGHASEVYPGVTPYTKGSELMNCETSAWGRALAAIGAPTKGHIASADEVRGARERRVTPVKAPAKAAPPEAERTVVESGAAGETGSGEGTVEDQPALPTPIGLDHEHTWTQSPTLRKFVVCSDPACRKVVKKEDAGVS